MQTPRQGIFGDSCAVLVSEQRDATKYLVADADVIPGLPAAMKTTTGSAERGLLDSSVDVTGGETGISYGAFIQLPINAVIGRQNLGDFASKQATVERRGRIVVREAVFQTNTPAGQVTISPFDTGVMPTIADIGKVLHAVMVSEPLIPGTPNILKWRVKQGAGAPFHGFSSVATIVGVSDDSSEIEIDLPGTVVAASTFND